MCKDFYVDKTSNTFADTLTAFGLGHVVQVICDRAGTGDRVRIIDAGPYYRVSCSSPITEEMIHAASTPTDVSILPFPAAPLIQTSRNANDLPSDVPKLPDFLISYEAEKQRVNAFWEARKGLSKEAKAASFRGKDHPELEALHSLQPPAIQWDYYRALNPGAITGYNALMQQWWNARSALPELLLLLLRTFSVTPNPIEEAEKVWKDLARVNDLPGSPQATASQIFNPAQGKGQNRAKADRLDIPGKNLKVFWLLEWLKAVGFFKAVLTKSIKGTKDRKTYVLAPANIDYNEHMKIMADFRDKMLFAEPATRSDILVAIRYTTAMMNHSKQTPSPGKLAPFARPRDVVSGFFVAFYKNLGNSSATMNLAFINLPGWIKVVSPDDVGIFLDVLEEHEGIIRGLDESHSDAYNLLSHYRDFIAGDNLQAFFEFAVGFSSYIISQRERNKPVRQFSTDNLRRLIMGVEPRLSAIIETEGFQNIANAIRQSTILPQYRRKKFNDRRYDVRYGLGQELARKSNYPDDFLAALGDFMHRYNAENAQVMENRAGPYRKSISTRDIEEIVDLVDEHGAPLICNLLVAYGYARTPRTPEAGSEEDNIIEEPTSEPNNEDFSEEVEPE